MSHIPNIPNIMLSLKKKIISQFRENFRTDGRTDGQTLFYKTLPAEAVGRKRGTVILDS